MRNRTDSLRGTWKLFLDANGNMFMQDDDGFDKQGLLPVWAHDSYPVVATMRVLTCKMKYDDGWVINPDSGFTAGDVDSIFAVTDYIEQLFQKSNKMVDKVRS